MKKHILLLYIIMTLMVASMVSALDVSVDYPTSTDVFINESFDINWTITDATGPADVLIEYYNGTGYEYVSRTQGIMSPGTSILAWGGNTLYDGDSVYMPAGYYLLVGGSAGGASSTGIYANGSYVSGLPNYALTLTYGNTHQAFEGIQNLTGDNSPAFIGVPTDSSKTCNPSIRWYNATNDSFQTRPDLEAGDLSTYSQSYYGIACHLEVVENMLGEDEYDLFIFHSNGNVDAFTFNKSSMTWTSRPELEMGLVASTLEYNYFSGAEIGIDGSSFFSNQYTLNFYDYVGSDRAAYYWDGSEWVYDAYAADYYSYTVEEMPFFPDDLYLYINIGYISLYNKTTRTFTTSIPYDVTGKEPNPDATIRMFATDDLTSTGYVETESFWVNFNCSPSWSCSAYDACAFDGTQNLEACTAVTDTNSCGLAFSGSLSDYDLTGCVVGGSNNNGALITAGATQTQTTAKAAAPSVDPDAQGLVYFAQKLKVFFYSLQQSIMNLRGIGE